MLHVTCCLALHLFTLRYIASPYVMLHHVKLLHPLKLSYIMVSNLMLRHATLYYIALHYVALCRVTSRYITFHHLKICHFVMSIHLTSCLFTSPYAHVFRYVQKVTLPELFILSYLTSSFAPVIIATSTRGHCQFLEIWVVLSFLHISTERLKTIFDSSSSLKCETVI